MPRLAIILMFTVLLGMVGVMISIPLIARDPLSVVDPRSPASFEYKNGEVSTTVRLQVDSFGRFVVVLPTYAQGHPQIPTLVFHMLDHDMPPLEPAVQVVSNHQFRANGIFPMRGRWQVSLQQGEKQQSFQFLLRE